MSMTESISRNQDDRVNKAKEVEALLDTHLKSIEKDIALFPSIKNKLERRKALDKKLNELKSAVDADTKKRTDDWIAQYHKKYDFIAPRSASDVKRIVGKLKHSFNKTKAILVNMELSNGDHTTFIAYPQKESFVWEKKSYVVIGEYKYYNHDAQLFCLDYHEDFVLPIKRSIPVDIIRKSVAGAGITDIENATNPSTLKRFIESEIIEKVMKGQALESALTMLKFLGIATVIGVYLHLVIYVIKSGMLQAIRF